MTKFKKINLVLGISFALTGCAGMNGQFDCNKVGGMGVGCTSLDQVNKMANQGQFNRSSSNSVRPTYASNNVPNLQRGYSVSAPTAGAPIRYSESIQQVWIAPYEDLSGNYHEPSLVYGVIKPSHWIGLPEQAIQNSDS